MHFVLIFRSSEKINVDDKDSVLYSVTLFQRVVDDFKEAARDMRFMVKDFTYDEEAKVKQDQKMTDLKGDMRKKFNMLVKWCSTMFSEAFIAWTHIKVLLRMSVCSAHALFCGFRLPVCWIVAGDLLLERDTCADFCPIIQ